MASSLLPWSSGFKTGDESIDDDHQELVRMINKLADMNAGSDVEGAPAVFAELSAYVVDHFEREEHLMERLPDDHPHVIKHRSAHAAFVSKVYAAFPSLSVSTEETLEDILRFLTKWLASHILGADRELVSLLRQLDGMPPHKPTEEPLEVLLCAFESLYFNMRRGADRLRAVNERLSRQTDELRQFRQAVESSPVSIVITDAIGRIQYANPKCFELTGFSRDELVGKTPAVFKSGQTSVNVYKELWGAVTSGNPWNGEILNRKKDGNLFWENVQIAPIQSDCGGPPTHFVGIKSDITSARASEQAMRFALEQSSRRSAELAALARLNEMLLVCDDEYEAFEALSAAAGPLLASRGVSGAVFSPVSDDILRLSRSFGASDFPVSERPFTLRECVSLRKRAPHSRSASSAPCCPHSDDRPGFCIPVISDDELSALVVVDFPSSVGDDTFDGLQTSVLSLCETFKLSIANIRMRRRLRDLAERDSLTGLWTRGLFERRASELFEAALLSGQPVCVAMIDVDHFKRFNDDHGHASGDAVLRHLGRCVSETLPPSAWSARYGGEEIFVLFPGFTQTEAVDAVETLRAVFSSSPVLGPSGPLQPATLSAGIHSARHEDRFAEAVALADEALYLSKTSGRDRVSLSSQLNAPPRVD